MARSRNPSVWVEKRRTKSGAFKYRARGEVDGRSLPSGPWTPQRSWAQEAADKMKTALWAGDREDATRRRMMLWDAWRDDYEKKRKTRVPETYRRFDKYVLASFSTLGKANGKYLQSLDKDLVDAWVTALMSAKDEHGNRLYGNTTIAMWFRSLSTAFNDAKGSGLIKVNPCAGATPPEEDEGGRALRDPELVGILNNAEPELWRSGQWALNCGPRLGEVVIFDWTMVEDERVHGAPYWFGRIPAHLRKARQKVKKDCRFPINDRARELMGPYRHSGLVFPHGMSTLQQQFAAARDAAGVPDASFHWLRHTFATRYLANEGHIEDLLETKLWSDYRSVLRYVHLDDDTLYRRFYAIPLPETRPLSAQKQEPPASR